MHKGLFIGLTNAGFRFGLPVNFQPILMVPNKKKERKLRVVLHNLFKYLDKTADATGIDVSCILVDLC